MRLLILVVSVLSCLLIGTASFAQRNLKDIPDPDPELERKSFIVADGFEVNLFAGDPKIAKPIQMNFDAKGRLWIASSEVYPHIKPGQKATDKILVLEDKNGDGKADSTTVFADGLLIPTGVVPDVDGCYVANSTELIHLRDTDGDGKADKKKIVLSGFGTEDTHHLLHTLRWGHDGCLYMNQSIYIHSHVETPYGVVRLNGGGIWRFRPETMKAEIVCRGFVNPWGHHFDYWGQNFATDGAYGEGINYVFPGAVYVTAPGAKRRLRGLNPGSPKHCGLEIVSGGHLPRGWQGNMITNDFRAHRVCRFVVTEDGSGFASRQEVELIKTKHVAFRPIDVKMGPDGAIYIADWYNPIIQHGEVDFRDPRRDHVHGRIWRVTAKGRALVKQRNMLNAPLPYLLDGLKAKEEWVRLWSKLILKSRNHDDVFKALLPWVDNLDKNDPNYDHHNLEVIWLLQCLNLSLSPWAEVAINPQSDHGKNHHVRAAAVRAISTRIGESDINPIQIFRQTIRDSHPRVRLETVRALSKIPTQEAAKLALQALDKPMDRFLDFALWQAMRDLQPFWLPAVQAGREDFGGNVQHLTFALKAVDSPGVVQPLLALIKQNKVSPENAEGVLSLIAALGGPKELGEVLNVVFDETAPADRRANLLNVLAATSQQRKLRPAGDLSRLEKLLSYEHEALAAAAVRGAGVWKQAKLAGKIGDIAVNKDTGDSVRDASFTALAALGDKESVDTLKQLGGYNNQHFWRQKAIAAYLPLDPKAAAREAVALLRINAVPTARTTTPAEVVRPFLEHKSGPAVLIAELADAKLAADIAKTTIRAVQQSVRTSPELIAALRKAGNLAESGWKLTPALLAELVAEVKTKGDPRRGEAIFRRQELQCFKCHAIGGAGGKVGPDLVSVGASAQPDYLIESLIEPNKKVKENFHSLMVQNDDGQVFTGIPVRKTNTELVLRDAEDREVTIPVGSIEVQKDGRSLMPDGSVDQLTRAELADLVRFLSELGKVGDFAISQARLVRRWQSLTVTNESQFRLRRTSFDLAATGDPAFVWQAAYSQVGGELPLGGLGKFTRANFTEVAVSFVRFEIDVSTAGEVKLLFNSADGLTLWLDGKPTPIGKEQIADLSRGRHVFTLAIDHGKRTQPLRVEMQDAPGSSAQAQIVGGK